MNIAIVGLSALFPGSSDITGFWRDILAGQDRLTDVPASHWRIDDYYDADPGAPDKTYAKRGGFLSPVDFDALGFGVPPATLPATDTSQLLALIVAQAVLEDAARERIDSIDRSRISVILGVTSAQELLFSLVSRLQRPVWEKSLRECGLPEDEVQNACARIAAHYVPWQEASFPGLLGNVVAGRIANRLNLGGTNCVTDAACASSLSALSMAVAELQLGHSDLAIAGGVDTLNDVFMYLCFSKTPALSPSGDCRPFSDKADGTMLGEGLGMLALKRLDDAERDGDRIYAVLRGLGSGSDGRSKSVYAPVAAGQAQALRRAYAMAGYAPRTVELVEAHGTGTKAGDVAEFEGLRSVFADGEQRQWCALGSVKSQIGHTKAAAGAAGLIKAVLALQHKVLPPTIKVERPDPRLAIDASPFYLNTRARPWVRGSEHPRRASVSSFGFGGSNFHATLEAYEGPGRIAERLPNQTQDLILLHGDSPEDLLAAARQLRASALPLSTLAHQSRAAWRNHARYRLAIVAADAKQWRQRLSIATARIEAAPQTPFAATEGCCGNGDPAGKLAFLFPGQGSQYLDMGAALAMQYPAAMAAWDAAADVSSAWGGLHRVVFPIPVFDSTAQARQRQALTATEWAQPALAATSLALLAVLRDLGIEGDCYAGHSFGELTALHAAGVFDSAALLRLARRRGEAMRDVAGAAGAMSAIAAPLDAVRTLLADIGDAVIANHNAPQQVVVSGSAAAIDAVEAQCRSKGIASTRLPVASAFHSPLVAAASDVFSAALAGESLQSPQRAVYANHSAQRYRDADQVRATLPQQLQQPVRFVDMIEAMYADGARIFVEVGPGQVLSGLCASILGPREHVAIALDRKDRDGVETLLQGLARLAATGVPIAAERLFAHQRRPAERTRAGHAVSICGSNLGKPYPPIDGAWPPPNPPRSAPSTPPDPASDTPIAHRPSGRIPPNQAANPPMTPSTVDPQWLAAFQALQEQTAAAHESYQRALSDSHTAYLRVAEKALAGLSGMLGSSALPTLPMVPAIAPAPAISVVATPAATPRASTVAAPAASVDAPRDDSLPPPDGLDRLLLDVVADKTGYPVDMLTIDMDLEGDLGVDSIKRVEILAAVEERAPNLPPVDRHRLGSMRTLAQIAAALGAESAHTAGTPRSAALASPPTAASSAPTSVASLLLSVVAEKTGYPIDMLTIDMDLEGDLGVDSIKRVEILAAVDERAPNLPTVDRSRLSAMRTLAEIVAALSDAPGAATAPANDAPAAAPRGTLGRFELAWLAAPPTGLAMPGLSGGDTLWIVGDTPLAAVTAATLQQRGVRAEAVATLPQNASACVFLGLRRFDSVDAALALNQAAFAIARQLAPRLGTVGGLLVTVQDGGAFGSEAAPLHAEWAAGMPALIKTCALEWPQAAVKAIDIDVGGRNLESIAAALADELLYGGGEVDVALGADGSRRTLISVVRPAQPTAPVIEAGDVVVVSGGARGVTAPCLVEWARRAAARFVLLGRTELDAEPPQCADVADADLSATLLRAARARGESPTPSQLAAEVASIQSGREVRRTLAALREVGAQARYLALPVEDTARLTAALQTVRDDWGPIRAVIHAAGVIADKRIADKTDAQFERVFATKVQGLRALLAATRNDPLRLLAVFSSVSARCGNTGQSDYAMANEVIAKVVAAEQRRRPGLRAKSLGWGPWEGGMVNPALRERFAALGVPMLPIAVGARYFADEMADAGATELVIGGEPRAAALLSSGHEARVDALEVRVDQLSHAWLAGHSIAGTPVLPMVLIAEWLARAVRSWRPGSALRALHDVRVLKGIRLSGFGNGGDRLRIEARPADAGQLALRVVGAKGELHYSARAELGAPAASALATPALALEPWNGEMPYGDLLFHRGDFEVIERIDGISDAGIAATLRGVDAAGWPGSDWQLDAAALDGGLQLAVLYGQRMLGEPTLPTSIAELRCHGAPPSGPVRAFATSRRVGASSTTMDIVCIDSQGRPLAEMIGVQNHAIAG